MKSLKLNDNWDIQTDDAGGIALTESDYGVAQTAANKIRLFKKDAYFNQTDGIPHFEIELGKPLKVAESTLINRIRKAAMSVDGVTDAQVSLSFDRANRYLGGNVYITTVTGRTISLEV